MIHFAPAGFLDVLPIVGGLYKRRNDFSPVGFDSPTLAMDLRRTANEDGTGDIVNAPILKEWMNMGAVLARIQRMLAVDLLGLVYVESLPARTQTSWKAETGEYFDRHRRLHLGLATNPGCMMHGGIEMLHLPAGHLFEINTKIAHCAVNFGEHTRYHLVVDARRPEA